MTSKNSGCKRRLAGVGEDAGPARAARSLVRGRDAPHGFFVAGLVGMTLGLSVVGCSGEDPTGPATADEHGAGGSASSGPGGEDATGGAGGIHQASCAYPTGVSSGVHTGDTLSRDLWWHGFVEQSSVPGRVAIESYYDCDDSKGIRALLVITASVTCEPCQDEASELEGLMQGAWGELGIRVVTLVLEDGDGEMAEEAKALEWKQTYGLESSAVAADPYASMSIGGFVATTPLHVLVDPRTMQVVDRSEGYDPDDPELVALAERNAPDAPPR